VGVKKGVKNGGNRKKGIPHAKLHYTEISPILSGGDKNK
jgi:hypothetical protein